MPAPMPKAFDVKVVGVTFVPTYPLNLHALAAVAGNSTGNSIEPIAAVLIRNPANQFDANAIEVHVPALGNQAMIGHLPARVAERLAPQLDAGETWQVAVTSVLIQPEHEDRPGISVHVARVDVPISQPTPAA